MRRSLLLGSALAFAAPTILVALFAPACDTNVIVPDGDSGGGGNGGSTSVFNPTTGGGGEGATTGPGPLEDVVDPGCENKPPPLESFVCNPEAQENGDCFPGEGCYIFVQYPDDPCGQEIYGSMCLPEGPGVQGSFCGGAQDCGGGLACVVTGSGTQCVTLCPLVGPSDCPSGLVCEPIDVDGFGGCL
jgi:hypothetical protein